MIMRHFIPFSFLFLSVFMLHAQTPTFGIVIHGGAGTIKKENMTPAMEAAYRSKLKEAIQTGYAILADGGRSSSAVEATIRVMEDSPLFNAAKGAVLTADGKVTLDASFMEGSKMDAGAVAGATQIKNPISAAIAVMRSLWGMQLFQIRILSLSIVFEVFNGYNKNKRKPRPFFTTILFRTVNTVQLAVLLWIKLVI